MRLSRLLCWIAGAIAPFALAAQSPAAAPAPRPFQPNDYYRMRSVRDPQLSPDGAWVAYTVSTPDSAADKSVAHIWMTSWDGAQTVQLTAGKESESSPRFSPDGRWIAFLSGRQEGKGSQVWLLDRRGGEAQRITTLPDGASDLAWSPDSKRLALVVTEDTTARKDTASKDDAAKPIVVTRYEFKRDVEGYLTSSNDHLLLLDIATRKVDTLTTGRADDAEPSWSPDGARIAFVRAPLAEPGTGDRSDIWVIDAKPGSKPRQLTTFVGQSFGTPAWSPDGTWIAYLQNAEPRYANYGVAQLAVIASDGSAPARLPASKLDRPVSTLTFAADGQSVLAIVEDDRASYLARIRIADGAVERLTAGRDAIFGYTASPTAAGRVALRLTTPVRSSEIFAFDGAAGSAPRQLSHQNDSFFALLQLGTERRTSRPGARTAPRCTACSSGRPDTPPARSSRPSSTSTAAPTARTDYSFDETSSSSRRTAMSCSPSTTAAAAAAASPTSARSTPTGATRRSMDLLGAVDEAVASGVADPDRLGIGGWSYGGISTDYPIASDHALQGRRERRRERAPAHDVRSGPVHHPVRARARRAVEEPEEVDRAVVSVLPRRPDQDADAVHGRRSDFNVPLVGGEQMYQALRALGVPTELRRSIPGSSTGSRGRASWSTG